MNTPWTLEQLCQTLRTGAPLPGDIDLLANVTESNIDSRRRMLALACMVQHFLSSGDTIDAIRGYALSGDDSYLRIDCLVELEKVVSIDDLLDTLLDDADPALRVFAIEYLLAHSPSKIKRMMPRLKADQDIRVHEILYCLHKGKPLPGFFYRGAVK